VLFIDEMLKFIANIRYNAQQRIKFEAVANNEHDAIYNR
jgi:hypothetical protein